MCQIDLRASIPYLGTFEHLVLFSCGSGEPFQSKADVEQPHNHNFGTQKCFVHETWNRGIIYILRESSDHVLLLISATHLCLSTEALLIHTF